MPGFVENYLLYLLAAASEKASADFHEEVRAAGVRVPEWRVLACLADEDGAMITHLAALALAEQSRLTRIIDNNGGRVADGIASTVQPFLIGQDRPGLLTHGILNEIAAVKAASREGGEQRPGPHAPAIDR